MHLIRLDTTLLPTLPVGDFAEQILVHTNHPDYAEVKIEIVGEVLSQVEVSRKVLIYRAKELTKTSTKSIRIETEEATLEIDQVKTPLDSLDIKLRRISEHTFILQIAGDVLV